jgi:small-conductance mechanosensitive channel
MVERKPVTPERRAQLAAASARYRARQKAIQQGAPIPKEALRKRAPAYHPPRVSPATSRARAVDKAERAVARAAQLAEQGRRTRAQTIGALPSVNNRKARIHVPPERERALAERKSAAGKQRQAEALREHAAGQKLQTIGKARKAQLVTELYDGQHTERLLTALDDNQRARFQRASETIARASNQTVAILFQYEGGQGDYSAVFDKILASPESQDAEEGVRQLEKLAKLSIRADKLYRPAAIGRLDI